MQKPPRIMIDSRWLDAIFAAVLSWWTYLLAYPDGHLFKTTPVFAGMAAKSSEYGWAWLTGAASLFLWGGILRNSSRVRLVSLSLAIIAFLCIANRIGVAAPVLNRSPFSTGWGAYGVLGLSAGVPLVSVASSALGPFYDKFDKWLDRTRKRFYKRKKGAT